MSGIPFNIDSEEPEVLHHALERWGSLLSECSDVSLAPNIPKKKLRKALRAYGSSHASEEDVLLLIDNTVLRSAKDGLLLTSSHLIARSGIGGELVIPLKEINSIAPDIRKHLKISIIGLVVNDEHFVALPGMGKEIESLEQPAVFVLVAMLHDGLKLKKIIHPLEIEDK